MAAIHVTATRDANSRRHRPSTSPSHPPLRPLASVGSGRSVPPCPPFVHLSPPAFNENASLGVSLAIALERGREADHLRHYRRGFSALVVVVIPVAEA
jgi:hypothetical protein